MKDEGGRTGIGGQGSGVRKPRGHRTILATWPLDTSHSIEIRGQGSEVKGLRLPCLHPSSFPPGPSAFPPAPADLVFGWAAEGVFRRRFGIFVFRPYIRQA